MFVCNVMFYIGISFVTPLQQYFLVVLVMHSQASAMLSGRGSTTLTVAALFTLSSFPRLCTNTDAGFPSWSTAECMVSPEGSVRSGSSRVQLRTALLSAPMATLVSPPPPGPARAAEGTDRRQNTQTHKQCKVVSC